MLSCILLSFLLENAQLVTLKRKRFSWMLICLSEIINLWGKQRMWWLHVYLWQQHVSGRAMQVNHKRHNPRWMFWWAPLFPSVCLCFSVGFPQRIDPICCVCCEWIIKAGECFHCQPGLFIPFYFTGSRVWFSNSVASCQNHWSSKISACGMEWSFRMKSKQCMRLLMA